ncbi:TIGR03620 family F420-dependent LLM class oxidoreductase [Kribbella sp. NPDC051586]|uniref:TIGR03620 family F420-dependent LLM class oxidoreductase n=1 Tax=Kribbella sp. NPDC051586 TaxID=3364118 RepID=UPI00378D56A0
MSTQEFPGRAGRVGVWVPPTTLDATAGEVVTREVARIDALGYGSLWTGERLVGAEAFARHGHFLASSTRLVAGTGIANIWARVPEAMRGGAATLASLYPDRFVLGIGASTASVVERVGATYDRPLARMRDYLERMAAVEGAPDGTYPTVLAALGPKMLGVAAELADGAHPWMVPVEHTAFARKEMGPDKLLIPHQPVVLTDDRTAAREMIRTMFGPLLGLASGSPYVTNLRRFGYGSDDADRVLDALFVYGDAATIAERVREHLDAGADHVLIHPLAADLTATVDQLEGLASTVLP